MKIITNVFGPDILLKEEVFFEKESATLGELLRALLVKRGESLKRIVKDDLSLEKDCIILVKGRNVSSLQNLETPIHDGDEITFTVLMAGG